jgi:TolA-binding protein
LWLARCHAAAGDRRAARALYGRALRLLADSPFAPDALLRAAATRG